MERIASITTKPLWIKILIMNSLREPHPIWPLFKRPYLAQSHLSLFGTGSDTNLRFKNVFYLTYFDFSLVSIDEFNFLKKSRLKKVEIVEIWLHFCSQNEIKNPSLFWWTTVNLHHGSYHQWVTALYILITRLTLQLLLHVRNKTNHHKSS